MASTLTGVVTDTEIAATIQFTDSSGAAADPTTVIFWRKSPITKTPTICTYDGSDPSGTISRVATGSYTAAWKGDESGKWLVELEGTGDVQIVVNGWVVFTPRYSA